MLQHQRIILVILVTSLSILVPTMVGAKTGSHTNPNPTASAPIMDPDAFDPIKLIERARDRVRMRAAARHTARVRAHKRKWAREKARIIAQRRAEKLARQAESAPAVQAGEVAAPSGALQSIAQCESGSNPSAVSSNGLYRGKYQFDYGTWASVGGSGDPAAASEAEQDKRAAILYAQRGAAPWPVCGR